MMTDLDVYTWESPPEFWDRLSKIELTRRALKELDARTKVSRMGLPHTHHTFKYTTTTSRVTRALTQELIRVAKDGGPDLSDLRGYPYPSTLHPVPARMRAIQSSPSHGSRSADPASTQVTPATPMSKKTSVYSRNFDQHLTDHHVYPLNSSEELDLDDVLSKLTMRRPSLSSSQFSDGTFKTFRRNNTLAKDEDDVMAHVLPIILGAYPTSHPSARNTLFGNLEPLTDGTIVPAKPDLYYGASPQELSPTVRNELKHYIIPSSMHDKPMIPNFFLEVKGPDGSWAVANRQARYNGALGARAMCRLQNYGEAEARYDGKTYTFSSIYYCGALDIFAHHLTPPTTGGGRPGYHMTQVAAYSMKGNRDGFIRGATAFRNARDLAEQHRHKFIQVANSREAHRATTAHQGNLAVAIKLDLDEEESFDEPAPGVVDMDDDVQASALPELGDATASFASDRPKRPRQPSSPDSESTLQFPLSKTRRPRGTMRSS